MSIPPTLMYGIFTCYHEKTILGLSVRECTMGTSNFNEKTLRTHDINAVEILNLFFRLPVLQTKRNTLSQKNATTSCHHNFNMCESILIIIGRNIAEKVGNQTMLYFPTSPK